MIKDSGERTEFGTGAVRDMHSGKGRMDLLPCEGCANINRPWNDSVCGHCSRLNDQRYDAYQKKG